MSKIITESGAVDKAHGGAAAGGRAPAAAQRQHRPVAARPGARRRGDHPARAAPAHQRDLRLHQRPRLPAGRSGRPRPGVAADRARPPHPVAHPPLFPPGTSFAYSNTDYILLGLVNEAATGRPLAYELQDRIFTPLGLHQTSLPYDDVTLPMPFAHGYLLSQPGAPGPVDVTAVSPSIAWAAGGIVSTAGDPGPGRRSARSLARAPPDTGKEHVGRLNR
jgi:hypothetical protein